VNGKVLNEAGIAGFIGGEMGVPMALASGDDALVAETREMLGPLEAVTVKTVFSRSAAAVLPPTTVHRLLRQAAARAVRRVRAKELRPLMMEKPYRIRFCLRRSFTEDDWVRETVGRLQGVSPDGGRGCFRYTSNSAEEVGNLLNEIEWTVLKP
jgi:D-amino peptidase